MKPSSLTGLSARRFDVPALRARRRKREEIPQSDDEDENIDFDEGAIPPPFVLPDHQVDEKGTGRTRSLIAEGRPAGPPPSAGGNSSRRSDAERAKGTPVDAKLAADLAAQEAKRASEEAAALERACENRTWPILTWADLERDDATGHGPASDT